MMLVIDINYEKNSLAYNETVKPIVDIVKDCEVKHYTENFNVEPYDKIIICSGLLKDNAFMKSKFEWIKTCDKPILGICAGMEIIALTYGAKLRKSREIGMTKIRTMKRNKLFSGKFEAYELHNFIPFFIKISRIFDVLAISRKGVQAMKHEKKDIYGVMFHPEVRNREIIENFVKL